jgi:hypothetical protein
LISLDIQLILTSPPAQFSHSLTHSLTHPPPRSLTHSTNHGSQAYTQRPAWPTSGLTPAHNGPALGATSAASPEIFHRPPFFSLFQSVTADTAIFFPCFFLVFLYFFQVFLRFFSCACIFLAVSCFNNKQHSRVCACVCLIVLL